MRPWSHVHAQNWLYPVEKQWVSPHLRRCYHLTHQIQYRKSDLSTGINQHIDWSIRDLLLETARGRSKQHRPCHPLPLVMGVGYYDRIDEPVSTVEWVSQPLAQIRRKTYDLVHIHVFHKHINHTCIKPTRKLSIQDFNPNLAHYLPLTHAVLAKRCEKTPSNYKQYRYYKCVIIPL